MQYKTLASAVEAIMNNECSIKNDDVPSLQRACIYVWPDRIEPAGTYEFYFNCDFFIWGYADNNPRPHFITATDFCRLMDENEIKERGITITNVSKKAEPIDLGKVFDENASDYRPSYFNGRVITREKFIEVVTKLLTEKSKAA